MEKIEVLPQFIFKFRCPNQELIANILGHLRGEEWIDNSRNLITADKRLDKNQSYEQLFSWFDKCLYEVKNDLQLVCDKLKVTQSWGNKSLSGQWHHPHIHSNSLISGIFYLVDSNASTWFSMNSIWNFSSYQMNYYNYQLLKFNSDDSFGEVIHKEKTTAGNLIIFPSALCHSVDEHNSLTSERYTISFNTFPCGKIGTASKSQYLEIDIK